MKRVLQISKYYYPFLGGTEQVARDIARALSDCSDIEQKIICFNEDACDESIICHKNETVHDYVDGVEVVRCGYELKISSQAISLSYQKELEKLMNDFNPDVIIFHYPNPFVTHFLLKFKKRNFKLYVYWHLDITKQRVLKHLFNKQNKDLIKQADKVVGATPIHLNESAYSAEMDKKKYILPYTIDEQNLQITKEEVLKANDIRERNANKTICFAMGRHVPYKGFRYLIDAASKLDDNYIFFIAGSGELTDELKAQASGNSNVVFLGRISDSDRRVYLQACDIFCFPSITRNEGFGLALAEAMYFGVPGVTFHITGSGVNYVNLDGVTGIECPNSDSNDYSEAIKKLANDNVLRKKYGEAARKRVLDNFTEENFKKNIQRLLNMEY